MKWVLKKSDADVVENLSKSTNISRAFAEILVQRGITTPEQMKKFLSPRLQDMHDPSSLADIEKAIKRVAKAIKGQEKIYIYGDYDVDGVTSTSLLHQCLKLLGGDVHFYLPHRTKEGYGLNKKAIDYIIKDKCTLVITVDCGIRAFETIAHAKKRGLDVIITDHHEIDDGNIPDAFAVINPKDTRGNYPFPSIAGVGVAFKLAWALCQEFSSGLGKKVRPELRQFLLDSMAFVAIGTIADVVPLIEENRVMAKYGLLALENSANIGIKALKNVSNLSQTSPLTSQHVGFRIGPRINAVGRLEHSRICVELLTTRNESIATSLARELETQNQKRRKLQQKIYDEAIEQLKKRKYAKDFVIVLENESWHVGVIGIVASRILELHYRPVCIIGLENGVGKASARSINGFNLFDALKACEHHLIDFGGHEKAAGFKIAKDQIEGLREELNRIAQETLTPEQLVPSLEVEKEIEVSDITWELLTQIEELAPFGERNPCPIFAVRNVDVVTNPMPERRGGKGEHLIFYVSQHQQVRRAVAFNKGGMYDELMRHKKCDMAFVIRRNTWNNNDQIELEVKDIVIVPNT